VRVLVLGGTHHVGRAAVEVALGRGDDVTTLNRGRSREPAAGVRALRADRTVPGELAAATAGEGPWDLVLDTWSAAPSAVLEAVTTLAARAETYAYVSTRSVYRWPIPRSADESVPVVDAEPGAGAVAYPQDKRGAELAVLGHWRGRSVIARAGLVLGPYEVTGRLPWWLRRLSDGGRVLAPGPAGRPLQYVDARDLVQWLLGGGPGSDLAGVFNATSEPGHATMGSLLAAGLAVTGSSAELVWVPPEVVLDAGIAPWNELPIWLPPDGEMAGLHDADSSAALAAGLVCRPVADTVRDTWTWLQSEGFPPPRTDRPPLGLDRGREQAVLAAWDGDGAG
jgi:2'-hydroxyisoflavone reductase